MTEVDEIVALADAYDDDGACTRIAALTDLAVIDELVARLRDSFAMRAIGECMRVAARLTHDDTARWLPYAIELAVTLFERQELGAANAVVDELHERTRHDRSLALRMRRELAAGLDREYELAGAIEQLSAAQDLAATIDERLAITGEIVELLVRVQRHDEARDLLASALRRGGDGRASNEALAAVHLGFALSTPDGERGMVPLAPEAEHHARIAMSLVEASPDRALRERAAVALGELCFSRGAYEEADAVVSAVTGSSALLEHIRRERGLAPDEPADEPPDEEPAPPLPDGLVQFYTYATDPPLPIIDAAKIREWSHGAITKLADLESEKIFGPRRSFWCRCGRYRGSKYRGLVCERCGVELITARSRQARTGHIQLAAPVLHPRYARMLARLLDERIEVLVARDGAELADELFACDVHRLCDELESRPTRKNAERLEVARVFRDRGLAPRDLMLSVLPVPPPDSTHPLFARPGVRRALAWLVEGHGNVDGLFAAMRQPG